MLIAAVTDCVYLGIHHTPPGNTTLRTLLSGHLQGPQETPVANMMLSASRLDSAELSEKVR